MSSGGDETFIKVVQDRLLSTMTLEDAKPHFFELYAWISERIFDDDLCCFNEQGSFFRDEQTVYIPNTGDGAKLVFLDRCVWQGPSWLRTVYALAFHEEYRSDLKIQRLFQDGLLLDNVDWGIYITELKRLHSIGVGLIAETQRIYQAIMEDIKDKED